MPLPLIVEAKHIALRLLNAAAQRRLTFTNGDRDLDQIRQIAAQGFITRIINRPDYPVSLFPNPTHPGVVQIATLRTLDVLVNLSTPQRPCELLSLYRPKRSAVTSEPHSRGVGLDIHAFGGWAVDNSRPQNCVKMVVALTAALPRRDYRIGLPKPPASDPHGMEPPKPRRAWPFFPPPKPRLIRLFGRFVVVMPFRTPDGQFVSDKRGNFLRPEILTWENEYAAPLSDVQNARVRQAIQQARRRGANLWMIFPDAADHIHLDVTELP